jgi:hypothetical protein
MLAASFMQTLYFFLSPAVCDFLPKVFNQSCLGKFNSYFLHHLPLRCHELRVSFEEIE